VRSPALRRARPRGAGSALGQGGRVRTGRSGVSGQHRDGRRPDGRAASLRWILVWARPSAGAPTGLPCASSMLPSVRRRWRADHRWWSSPLPLLYPLGVC
jgi:hypothetical protein